MTTERDSGTRIVLSWLREDEHENAERVLLRALDEVDTTPQRRSWWPARRSTLMNNYVKLAIAAAAVLAVAFVGYRFLPSNGGPGVAVSPAAPTPTVAPTPVPTLRAPGPGALDAGRRYAWSWTGPPISFAVPAGWTGIDTDIFKHRDKPTELTWYLETMPVIHVYTDACHSAGALKPVERTVDGFVAALDTQLNTDATVTDVTVGGRPAKRIDLVASPGLDRATCRNGAVLPIQIWADPAETSYYSLFPGTRGFVHLMDIDGKLAILCALIAPEATPADIAELEAIVASVQIEP